MKSARSRYVAFALIALFFVVFDQGTKIWADHWLASPRTLPEFPDHRVELVVEPAQDGKALSAVLGDRLTLSSEGEVKQIIRRHLLVDGGVGPFKPERVVKAGQRLTILRRTVKVIDSAWHFRFVRNPAAAWGFLKSVDISWRRPIFIVITLFSIGLIITLFVRSEPDQPVLHVALACILGGAVGNLIDRIRLGFVIDFIHWFVVVGGKPRVWPTFNVADIGITVGVGLLLIEIFRSPSRNLLGKPKEVKEEPKEEPEAPKKAPARG